MRRAKGALGLLLGFLTLGVTTLGGQAPGQPVAASRSVAKALRFGKLVGATTVLTNAIVIIESDRIQSVSASEAPIPPNIEVIDLSRYTGIAGMIDMHTHLTGTDGGPRGPTGDVAETPNQAQLRSPVVEMFLAQGAPRMLLEAGFTTVRDLGADDFVDIAMRELINR